MKYKIGERVRIIRGYRGYRTGIVVEYECGQYVLELESGMLMNFHERELEDV